MKLDDLKVYQKAMELGDICWNLVSAWNYFEKDTIGKQLVRASDSIAANISEGFRRFHFKENIHFNYIARGSLFETKTWIDKAVNRNLISHEQQGDLQIHINDIARMLNSYISSIEPNQLKEPDSDYQNNVLDPFSNDQ
ncbi:MAG: four helix bundle protein [Prolixibacteraceae bacterium]|nr:four helix bundle protein [Prolixibacteraceae bacterium]